MQKTRLGDITQSQANMTHITMMTTTTHTPKIQHLTPQLHDPTAPTCTRTAKHAEPQWRKNDTHLQKGEPVRINPHSQLSPLLPELLTLKMNSTKPLPELTSPPTEKSHSSSQATLHRRLSNSGSAVVHHRDAGRPNDLPGPIRTKDKGTPTGNWRVQRQMTLSGSQ